MKRIILAVTGASGTIYAKSLLEALVAHGVETHLIVSDGACEVMRHEEGTSAEVMSSLAHKTHACANIAAPPASGSWRHDGMVVCPCSMASLAAIANGLASNLVHRAADVCLKERKPLLLIVRETPLNLIHIENMHRAATAGAVIMPASPAFYNRPETIADFVRHFVARIMDQLGIRHELAPPWGGRD